MFIYTLHILRTEFTVYALCAILCIVYVFCVDMYCMNVPPLSSYFAETVARTDVSMYSGV